MDAVVTRSDPINMNATTKTYSVIRTVSALSLAALLTSHALATPPAEPRRFFDVEKGRFVLNPDYRDPSPAKYVARRNPAAEPRRMFDPESGNFVANPDYHEPASTVRFVHRVGEPRRFFDIEKGRFVLNPDYR